MGLLFAFDGHDVCGIDLASAELGRIGLARDTDGIFGTHKGNIAFGQSSPCMVTAFADATVTVQGELDAPLFLPYMVALSRHGFNLISSALRTVR
jgi:hypothetical protein